MMPVHNEQYLVDNLLLSDRLMEDRGCWEEGGVGECRSLVDVDGAARLRHRWSKREEDRENPCSLTKKTDFVVSAVALVRCRHWETTIVQPRLAKMDEHWFDFRTDAVRDRRTSDSVPSCSVHGEDAGDPDQKMDFTSTSCKGYFAF